MYSFLNTINYSSYNEDGNSELKALNISDGDNVLCITGSGARTLDLLIASPKMIVSIDFNPHQNALLEIKMAAIRELSYDEFLTFIGIRPSAERKIIYSKIKSLLSAGALSFWDNNQSIIENGIIYCGRWEKYFRLLAKSLQVIRPKLVKKLFSCDNQMIQKELWQKKWNDREWRIFLSIISQRFVWKYMFADPGFYKYVPDDFSTFRYICQRFDTAVEKIHFKQSAFLTMLFWGKFIEDWNLPLHLQSHYYGILKSNLSRIKIITHSLLVYLQNHNTNQFNKYSLSDFSSYTSSPDYKHIWEEIIARSVNKARFCERQFLVKQNIPPELSSVIIRDQRLEREIEDSDTSIFYSFLIGKILKK